MFVTLAAPHDEQPRDQWLSVTPRLVSKSLSTDERTLCACVWACSLHTTSSPATRFHYYILPYLLLHTTTVSFQQFMFVLHTSLIFTTYPVLHNPNPNTLYYITLIFTTYFPGGSTRRAAPRRGSTAGGRSRARPGGPRTCIYIYIYIYIYAIYIYI